MSLPVLPDDDGIRPAGAPDKCFYCGEKVWEDHKPDCVILLRRVRVAYVFALEIEVPHDWAEEDILYNRNDGTWCADNAIKELEELQKKRGCLCSTFECRVIDIPDKPPYRKNDNGEIIPKE